MKNIKGTQTEKNLLVAFAGESQARMRYGYYAKVAVKEGLHQMAAIFEETADNERSHAKQFLRYLEGGAVEIKTTYSTGNIGTTLENLKSAAKGENEEWTALYPSFAAIAREEGFPEIAAVFDLISTIEKVHEKRFRKLYQNLEEGKVFKRNMKVVWKCRVCGYLHEGDQAPQMCAACRHPQAYFELFVENY